MTNAWAEWIDREMTRRGWRAADTARALDVDDSLISRWRRGKQVPDLDSCRSIAEQLGLPVLTILVAAGHLTAEEAGTPPVPEVSAATVSTLELIEELRTRISDHLDELDPPPPGRHSRPPRRASEVADVAFSSGDVDQTEQSGYSDRVQ